MHSCFFLGKPRAAHPHYLQGQAEGEGAGLDTIRVARASEDPDAWWHWRDIGTNMGKRQWFWYIITSGFFGLASTVKQNKGGKKRYLSLRKSGADWLRSSLLRAILLSWICLGEQESTWEREHWSRPKQSQERLWRAVSSTWKHNKFCG